MDKSILKETLSLVASNENIQVIIMRTNNTTEEEAIRQAAHMISTYNGVAAPQPPQTQQTIQQPSAMQQAPQPNNPIQSAGIGGAVVLIQQLQDKHNMASSKEYKRGLYDAIELVQRYLGV